MYIIHFVVITISSTASSFPNLYIDSTKRVSIPPTHTPNPTRLHHHFYVPVPHTFQNDVAKVKNTVPRIQLRQDTACFMGTEGDCAVRDDTAACISWTNGSKVTM